MGITNVVRSTHPDRIIASIVAILLVVAAFAALTPITPASAAQEEQLITFRILKLDCEEDPGQVPDDLTPEGCTPAEGVSFEIAVEGNDEALNCTTNAEGRCQVEVPSEAMVTVTEDESTATEGYRPRENPMEVQAVTEFAGAIFVNVADAEPDPEPPTTGLPDTGAGPDASQHHTLPVVAIVMLASVLALGSGIMGFRARR